MIIPGHIRPSNIIRKYKHNIRTLTIHTEQIISKRNVKTQKGSEQVHTSNLTEDSWTQNLGTGVLC
jgi:hypothetical protein